MNRRAIHGGLLFGAFGCFAIFLRFTCKGAGCKEAIGEDHRWEFGDSSLAGSGRSLQGCCGPDLFEIFHGELPNGLDVGILGEDAVRGHDHEGMLLGDGDQDPVEWVSMNER